MRRTKSNDNSAVLHALRTAHVDAEELKNEAARIEAETTNLINQQRLLTAKTKRLAIEMLDVIAAVKTQCQECLLGKFRNVLHNKKRSTDK